MLKNAVLDVKKFADGAENEPFEVHKRVGGRRRSPYNNRERWRSLERRGVAQRSRRWRAGSCRASPTGCSARRARACCRPVRWASADRVAEFALAPDKNHDWEGDVQGPCAMCPVCVRKLQFACGFDLRDRYVALVDAYEQLGMHEQEAWCREVLKRGDAVAVESCS